MSQEKWVSKQHLHRNEIVSASGQPQQSIAKQQSSDFLPCFGDQKLSAYLQTSLLANCRGGMCGRPGAAQVLTAVLNVASYFLQAQACLALHST